MNKPTSWLQAIEQIVLSLAARQHRTIGFTAPERCSGVSSVARGVAACFARAGFKTILVDLTYPGQQGKVETPWVPGSGEPVRSLILHTPNGHDALVARPTDASRSIFNNVQHVRQSFGGDLDGYDKVIVDIPAVLETDDWLINPVAAAAACDSVMMVCVRGKVVQSRLAAALDGIRAAGGNVTGTVLNEWGYSSAGAEIAVATQRWLRWLPPLRDWVAQKALRSEILN